MSLVNLCNIWLNGANFLVDLTKNVFNRMISKFFGLSNQNFSWIKVMD